MAGLRPLPSALVVLALAATPAAAVASTAEKAGGPPTYSIGITAKITTNWTAIVSDPCSARGSGTSSITLASPAPVVAQLRYLRSRRSWGLFTANGRRNLPLPKLVGTARASGRLVAPPTDSEGDPCPPASPLCVGQAIRNAYLNYVTGLRGFRLGGTVNVADTVFTVPPGKDDCVSGGIFGFLGPDGDQVGADEDGLTGVLGTPASVARRRTIVVTGRDTMQGTAGSLSVATRRELVLTLRRR